MTEEKLAKAARQGDQVALERLVRHIRTPIYNLAVRMLGNSADAEDATQEIIIKISTHIRNFRGESRFSTWYRRVATNHLLNMRKHIAKQQSLSLNDLPDHTLAAQVSSTPADIDPSPWLGEAKIACMQAMLLRVSRAQRAVYILGDILGLASKQAAEILDITPEAYRKRLSRARQNLRDFVQLNCGLARPGNPCRCWREMKTAIEKKVSDSAYPLARLCGDNEEVLRGMAQMEELSRATVLFRTHPTYQVLETVRGALHQLLNSRHVPFLS
jgi:RNA polymerase sigma factor (sigma-70 family)